MSIVDKLTPHPPLAEGEKDVRLPKPPLTVEEMALLTRASTFIASALHRHGIQLAPKEIAPIGAEVADFVMTEVEMAMEEAAEAAVAALAAEPPKAGG